MSVNDNKINTSRETQLSYIIDDVLRNSFVDADEVETRLKIESYVAGLEEIIGQRTCEWLNDYFYSQDMFNIKQLYNKALTRPKVDYKKEVYMEGRELLNKICNNKSEPLIVYKNGSREHAFKIVKTFEFEGRYYTLLRNLNSNKEKYFSYQYDDKTKEEKLIPVSDKNLTELFVFLGL